MFSQTIPWFHPSSTAVLLESQSAFSAGTGKLLLCRPHVSHPHPALPRSSGQGQMSPFWERDGPISPLPLPACWQTRLSGGSEGSAAQLTSGESLQQLPWCHLIHREGQQPSETRTRCSHGPDPSPCVWEHTRDLSPASSSAAATSSGTRCNRQSKNFQLLRNGALWSLLLKALYNPSVKCAMKCKVLLLSQTKIIFLFLKYLGISQHFPNKSL